MTRPERDKMFTEVYSFLMAEQVRLSSLEGRRTLKGFIDRRIFLLRYQLLPHYFDSPPAWRLRLRSFGGPRVLPDFACLGATKSGTSDLSTYLLQHPCILPPLTKEIPSPDPSTWLAHYPTVQEKKRVEQEHGKALCGYFFPTIMSARHLEGYHAARPDAKIIILLRNPVDRCQSQYKSEWFRIRGRMVHSPYWRTFAEYVDVSLDLFPTNPIPAPFMQLPLLQAGIYVKSVERWINRFGKENVHILRAEDFFKDVAGTVCSIHEFLGIPPIAPEIHPILNQSPIAPPPFEAETRRKLQEFYRPWNEKLYALIGRDMEWDR